MDIRDGDITTKGTKEEMSVEREAWSVMREESNNFDTDFYWLTLINTDFHGKNLRQDLRD